MTKNARSPTAELLRRLLQDSGQSMNALARATGVAQPILHRFLAGEQGITLANADKLFSFFGLELRQRQRSETGRAGRCNAPPA